MKNCLVIIGEQSGQEHARTFLLPLMAQVTEWSFWGVGGDEFAQAGGELIYHLKEFSTMGFSDVLGKLAFYHQARINILEQCKLRQTSAAILVDYQGFNISLLKPLKELGLQVHYVVAPQCWAWKEGRVETLKDRVHRLYCILPFEQSWFRQRGLIAAQGVQHPLWQQIDQITLDQDSASQIALKKKLVLLPGSRSAEVTQLAPIFAQTLRSLGPEVFDHIVAIRPPGAFNKEFDYYFKPLGIRQVSSENLNQELSGATLALAASGTVTLSCALAGVPVIVCYRVNLFNEFIFHSFVRYRGAVSLVNLLAEKPIVPELLQENCLPPILKYWLIFLIQHPERRASMNAELLKLRRHQSSGLPKILDLMVGDFK